MDSSVSLNDDHVLKNLAHIVSRKSNQNDNDDVCHTQTIYLNSLWLILKKVDVNILNEKVRVFNALTVKKEQYSYLDILNTLATLDYCVTPIRSLKQAILSPLTVVMVDKKNAQVTILYKSQDHTIAYDPAQDTHTVVDDTTALVGNLFVTISKKQVEKHKDDVHKDRRWFAKLLRRFMPLFASIVCISIISHVFSLAIPMYIIFTYVNLINSGDISTLMPITAGVIIFLLSDQVIRYIRAKTIAWIGSRVDYIVSNEVFDKTAKLPINQIETVPTTSQIARLKSFSSLRDFFTSAIFTSLMEVPAVLIMIVLLSIFHIYYTVITGLIFFLYVMTIYLFSYLSKEQINNTATYNTHVHQYLHNYFSNITNARKLNLSQFYKSRISGLSKKALYYDFISTLLSVGVDNIGRLISALGVIGVLSIGVYLIWDGRISVANLLGASFLIWRIFTPAQVLCSTVIRFEKIAKTIKQVNDYMELPEEVEPETCSSHIVNLAGNISFQNVGVHFRNQTNLTLRNFTLNIAPGELVVITGQSGAGKSLLLKLLLAAYQPSMGMISIDEQNIAQFNRHDLRRFISYVPQKQIQPFGSIYDSLSLSNPLLTRSEIDRILKYLDIYDAVQQVENCSDEDETSDKQQRLPLSLLSQLNVVNMYTKNSPIKCIDGGNFDSFSEEIQNKLISDILSWKGKSTVIIVTNNTQIKEKADKLVVLGNNSEHKIYEKPKQ